MRVAHLHKNTNPEHIKKFAQLYKNAVHYTNLYEYREVIYYYLPNSSTELDDPYISTIMIDYEKLENDALPLDKNSIFIIENLNVIFNKLEESDYNYQFTKTDMNMLNSINRLILNIPNKKAAITELIEEHYKYK